MTKNKDAAECPLRKMVNDTGNDETAVLGEGEIITIFKANMGDCPFLAMAKEDKGVRAPRGVGCGGQVLGNAITYLFFGIHFSLNKRTRVIIWKTM